MTTGERGKATVENDRKKLKKKSCTYEKWRPMNGGKTIGKNDKQGQKKKD